MNSEKTMQYMLKSIGINWNLSDGCDIYDYVSEDTIVDCLLHPDNADDLPKIILEESDFENSLNIREAIDDFNHAYGICHCLKIKFPMQFNYWCRDNAKDFNSQSVAKEFVHKNSNHLYDELKDYGDNQIEHVYEILTK